MKDWREFGIELPANAHGSEVDTTCPQCSASRRKKYAKCLSVNTDLGVWVCHHCAWAGSLREGEYQPPQQRRYFVKPKIYRLTALPEKVVAWFQRRGISERILREAHIGWGEMYFGELEEQAWCIQYPYYRNG